MELKDKIILWHRDGLGGYLAFDLFIKKGTKLNKFESEFANEYCYKVDCAVAKKFVEKNPDYEYLGSEDLHHIPQINSFIQETLEKLKKNNWQTLNALELDIEEIQNE